MGWRDRYVEFSILVGKTITAIDRGDDTLKIACSDGHIYQMYHRQACCESVYIEDICGDLEDLIGSPVLTAEERSYDELPEGTDEPEYRDSDEQWTFYELATVKGSVTIRWYGSSNGYYSTSVDFERIDAGVNDDDA